MKKIVANVRKALIALIADETLYLFLAFMYWTVFQSNLFCWYRQQLDLLYHYVIIPWSLILCVLRLMRSDEHALMKRDTGLLTAMFLWVTVPFALRFGFTFNNVTSWYGHAVVFFAVYAMTREEEPGRRAAMLDRLCALFALAATVWGGMLLATVVTKRIYTLGSTDYFAAFGVQGGTLQMGMDRNSTSLCLVCMLMMCAAGMSRRKRFWSRLLYLIPTAMMALCVVLTQSRTARYSVVIAFAVGAFGAAYARINRGKRALRLLAALAIGSAVLLASYAGAKMITKEAVEYYNDTSRSNVQTEESGLQEIQTSKTKARVRVGIDSTLSDRTNVWKNLFKLWREEPKYLVMGRGVGNVGKLIVKDTIHEANGAVAVHNTYLQLIADFGIIGAVLTAAFLLTLFFPALRMLMAPKETGFPGARALCMLVVAILATGMLESQPLGANTQMNMMLYYALAVLNAEGQKSDKKA